MKKRAYYIKKIVLIGLLAATITGGKLALAALPNVEIVTLLIMVYAAVFGISVALPATIIFVSCEMFLYGVNTWVISYYIHWPAICLVTLLFHTFFKEKFFIYPIIAFFMTAMFGVLTTTVDTLFGTGFTPNFFKFFPIIYVRGIWFYVVHVVFNTLFSIAVFKPLYKLLTRLKASYFGASAQTFD